MIQSPSMATPPSAPPAERMVPVTLTVSEGTVPLVGQRTAVPGLLITPSVYLRPVRFSGGWSLTHQPSGRCVVQNLVHVPLIYAREAVEILRESGVDWDRPADQMRADPAALRAARQAWWAAWDALLDGTPLYWARESVLCAQGRYTLRCAAPLCGADAPDSVPQVSRLSAVAPTRADLDRSALAAHWRPHGERWLCPGCADAHPLRTPDHDGC